MTKKTTHIHIRITDDRKTRIYAIAHRHGMTPSEYVRAVVDMAYPPRPRDRHLARDQIAECIDRNLSIAGITVDTAITRSIAANIATAIDEYGYPDPS